MECAWVVRRSSKEDIVLGQQLFLAATIWAVDGALRKLGGVLFQAGFHLGETRGVSGFLRFDAGIQAGERVLEILDGGRVHACCAALAATAGQRTGSIRPRKMAMAEDSQWFWASVSPL